RPPFGEIGVDGGGIGGGPAKTRPFGFDAKGANGNEEECDGPEHASIGLHPPRKVIHAFLRLRRASRSLKPACSTEDAPARRPVPGLSRPLQVRRILSRRIPSVPASLRVAEALWRTRTPSSFARSLESCQGGAGRRPAPRQKRKPP